MSEEKSVAKAYLDSVNDKICCDGICIDISKQVSRCLSLLISRSGSVVSKIELVESCWAIHGTLVSDVTVRQALFNIRKVFSHLDLPPNTLSTVRGKGYMLAKNVVFMSDGILVDKPDLTVREKKHLNLTKQKKHTFFVAFYMTFLFLFLFLLTAAARYSSMIHEVTYAKIGSYKGITFYTQKNDNHDLVSLYHELKFISDKLKIKERDLSHIYINNQSILSISIFSCNKPLEDKSSKCVSIIKIGKKD